MIADNSPDLNQSDRQLRCPHCNDYAVNWGGEQHIAQTETQAQAWVDQHAVRCHRRLDYGRIS